MQENGKIYFIRHGQTDRNAEGKMNPGDVDSDLNDTGIKQAIKAGKHAKTDGLSFDIIISSPLVRAKATAGIIAKETGYSGDIMIDSRLKEQLAGKFKDYSHADFKKEFNIITTEELRRIFKSKKYNGIEDITDFRDRVSEFYKEIKNKYSDRNVLIVGHSGTARIILMNAQDIDFEEAVYKRGGIENGKIIDTKKEI